MTESKQQESCTRHWESVRSASGSSDSQRANKLKADKNWIIMCAEPRSHYRRQVWNSFSLFCKHESFYFHRHTRLSLIVLRVQGGPGPSWWLAWGQNAHFTCCRKGTWQRPLSQLHEGEKGLCWCSSFLFRGVWKCNLGTGPGLPSKRRPCKELGQQWCWHSSRSSEHAVRRAVRRFSWGELILHITIS